MKLDHCNYDLETTFTEGCDPCRRSRFTRRVPLVFGNVVLYVTLTYEVKVCPLGLAGGDLLYAQSLLPGECQEVEIVQRAKYERALHEQRSVESHFESSFMSTLASQVSSSLDVNTSTSVGGGFNFFGLVSGGASGSVNTASHFDASVFAETVSQASASVSNYYEMSVDTKTEIENKYRSLRKICNPNNCRVVTYFFKQLMKKYELTVSVVGIRFDIGRGLADIHAAPLNFHIEPTRLVTSQVTPAALEVVNPDQAGAVAKASLLQAPVAAIAARGAALQQSATPALRLSATDGYRNLVFREVDDIKMLDLQALAQKADALKLGRDRDELLKAAGKLAEARENQAGFVVFQTEYCLRTGSVIAEPKVSACGICTCDECDCDDAAGAGGDESVAALRRRKLQLQVELLEKQLADAGGV